MDTYPSYPTCRQWEKERGRGTEKTVCQTQRDIGRYWHDAAIHQGMVAATRTGKWQSLPRNLHGQCILQTGWLMTSRISWVQTFAVLCQHTCNRSLQQPQGMNAVFSWGGPSEPTLTFVCTKGETSTTSWVQKMEPVARGNLLTFI